MNPDLEQLAALDRDALRAALSRALTEHAIRPTDWRAVVELYTAKITEQSEQQHSGDVGDVGDDLALYERLLDASEQAGVLSPLECATRRLNLASVLLTRLPARHDGSLLDPDHIVELLLGALPITPEAAASISDWRTLDRTEILRLRTAKNLLKPALAALDATNGDTLDERVKPWEAVLPRLP
ncbi:MAG TPA: hypothetical protein VGZ32_08920 [Actinocrinis sp.]|jgi:hypothetical protein|uniref:hypothetical protein n=1 Tax=Actinocrinis sp. TaxID=1920516 RepID=UPI002DDDB244|nr:hypothetical protein [Actinocrinis sp.]HEV3170448.1 hypothetical protein [Actinocrinis sp.]